MNPSEIFATMNRDKRLDAFRASNKQHLFDEFLWKRLQEAERDVLKDTHARVKEQDITLSSGARAVNLPDDYMISKKIRWKQSTDDALFEGYNVEIADEEELP